MVKQVIVAPVRLSKWPGFSGDRVARSLVFCEVFCRSLLVILSLSLSFWQLLYLSFFDLPIVMAPFLLFVYMFSVMNIGEILSIKVKQVIVSTVKLSKWCWTIRHPWFSSFLDSSNPLSMKSWQEPQALEYRINWEINHTLNQGSLMVQHHFERFMVATMTCFIMANIFVAMYPGSVTRTVSTSWSVPLLWLIAGFVTRFALRVPGIYGWDFLFTNNKERG
jgi:hypothetical protein